MTGKLVRIEADEALFNRWRDLGERVKLMGGIVQNNMMIEEADLLNFCENVEAVCRDIRQLGNNTFRRIKGKAT